MVSWENTSGALVINIRNIKMFLITIIILNGLCWYFIFAANAPPAAAVRDLLVLCSLVHYRY